MVHCGSIPTAIYGRVVPWHSLWSLCLCLFAVKILLFMSPLLTYGVLHSCFGACL